MTERENSSSGLSLPPEYAMPEDQLQFELGLIDSFARDYPNSKGLLSAALSDVKRATGFDIPKYTAVESLSDSDPHEQPPEIGGTISSDMFSFLVISSPKEYSQKEIDYMTSEERAEASSTSSGSMVVGEMPKETRAILDGLYSLLGASEIRNDRLTGMQKGMVLRKGVYQGEELYIQELYFDNCPYYQGRDTLRVAILGSKAGQAALKELTNEEVKDFAKSTGMDVYEAAAMSARRLLTSENVKGAESIIDRAQQITDGAVQEEHSQTPSSSSRGIVRPKIEKSREVTVEIERPRIPKNKE